MVYLICSVFMITIVLLFPTSEGVQSSTAADPPKAPNLLENRHLRVVWARHGGEYNKSYVGPKKGGLMIDYLANRFKFSYSYVPTKEKFLSPVGSQSRGLVDYLFDGQCDVLAHDVMMTPEYNAKMDLTLPWLFSSIDFMVPIPSSVSNSNIDSVIKPFQYPVWVSMGISVILVILTLKFTSNSPSSKSSSFGGKVNDDDGGTFENGYNRRNRFVGRRRKIVKLKTWNLYLYIFGLLLSQGGPCVRRNLSSRLVAGAWCLVTFVLVQAYASILFTYVVKPSSAPFLVNSVYDMVNKPKIQLVILAGQNYEKAIMETTENTGIFSQLRDKLEAYPKTHYCYSSSECVSLVKAGPNIVHGNGYPYLIDYIVEDFKATRKCNLQLIGENFWPHASAWGLPKGSPYTESISIGIIELWQYGFMQHWDEWFRPIPQPCRDNLNMKQGHNSVPDKKSRLSFRNLMGAFIVLFVGYCLAFLSFLGEQIFNCASRNHRPCRH